MAVFCVVVVVITSFAVLQAELSRLGNDDKDEYDIPEPGIENVRRLTLAQGESTNPVAASGPSGTVYLAWLDTRFGGRDILFKSSENGGRTFGSDRRLVRGLTEIRNLTISGTELGIVALAFDARAEIDKRDDRAIYLLFSKDNGTLWSPMYTLSFGVNPSLALVNDVAYVSFVEISNVERTPVLRTVGLGLDKGRERDPTAHFGYSSNASELASYHDGEVMHLAWVEPHSQGRALVYASENTRTGERREPRGVRNVEGDIDARSLWIGRVGRTLAVLWSDNSSGIYDIYMLRSTDGGSLWFGGRVIHDPREDSRGLSVSADDSNHVMIVFRRMVLGTWQIYSALLNEAGDVIEWRQKLTNTVWDARNPSITWDPTGRFFAVWQDYRDGNWEIYGDDDVGMTSLSAWTMRLYARRLPEHCFKAPSESSRNALLARITEVGGMISSSNNRESASYLRNSLMPLFDGFKGNDPKDDLILDGDAQNHLWNLANSLADSLYPEEHIGGTRVAPGILPPGEPPPDDETPVRVDIICFAMNTTGNSTEIGWSVKAKSGKTIGSWVDYWVVPPEYTRIYGDEGRGHVTLWNLQRSTTYRYRVGAWVTDRDQATPEYAYSRNKSFRTDVVIKWVGADVLNENAAKVRWGTNLNSTSTVYYGLTEDMNQTKNGTADTLHEVTLTNLTSGVRYYYQVFSVGVYDSNLSATSGTLKFNTGIMVTQGPSVSQMRNQTGLYASVQWETNWNGTSVVHYGLNDSYGSVAYGANDTISHLVNITDLSPDSAYHFKVNSTNTANLNDSVERVGLGFTTPSLYISNLTVMNITGTSVELHWNTTFGHLGPPANTTAEVKYGITENETYNYTVEGSNGTTHVITLSSLQSGKTYHYQVRSEYVNDTSVNASISNRSFTTLGIELSGSVGVQVLGPFDAKVFWNTSMNGTGIVDYYTDEYTGCCYERDMVTGPNGTYHEVNLTGLRPSTGYKFRIKSTSLSNEKDWFWTDWDYSFETQKAQDDARSQTDAGGTPGLAIQIPLGNFTGEVGGTDSLDYYKVNLQEGQEFGASLHPSSGYDFDLRILSPNGTEKAFSNNSGSSPEYLSVVTDTEGLWMIEVSNSSGPGLGYYDLAVNATSGPKDHFVLEVGSSGDFDVLSHLPGLSLVSGSGWSDANTSGSPSYASWKEEQAYPDYRESSNGSRFYLNLYGKGPQRYTDYQLTFQYYCTADTNVSFYNGAGWAHLGTLEGRSAWWTTQFIVEHTSFHDYDDQQRGMNVAFRFSNVTQIDKITAVGVGHTTYVGNGSDDTDPMYHNPGILLEGSWVNDGHPYKNGTSGSSILLNIPDPDISYVVAMTYNSTGVGTWVEQYNGSAWHKVAKPNGNLTRVAFSTKPDYYHDADANMTGLNIRIRFASPIQEVTSFKARMAAFANDVGFIEDNITTDDNETYRTPGISVLTHNNSEWSQPVVTGDGRTVRIGQPYANIFINSPVGCVDQIVTLRFQVSAGNGNGQLRQWNGTGWVSIGSILAYGYQWQTVSFRVMSAHFADYYGTEDLNVLLEVTTGIALDAMAVQTDSDMDGIGDFQETYGYHVYNDTTEVLDHQSDVRRLDFYTDSPGRYQFEVDVEILGGDDILIYIDEEMIQDDGADDESDDGSPPPGGVSKYAFRWSPPPEEEEARVRGEDDESPEAVQGVGLIRLNKTLCDGSHYVAIYMVGYVVTVNSIRVYRDQTDYLSNDTDMDRLGDYEECCGLKDANLSFFAKPIDPLNSDTDFDKLSDFDELYYFFYSNTTNAGIQGNESYEHNVTVDGMGMYEFTVSLSATPESGENLTARVFVDGMLRASYGDDSSWSEALTFSARLYRGFHVLNVTIGEARGNLTINSIHVNKSYDLTDPVTWDTDRDDLGDGEELMGDSGWILDPTNPDCDGDGRRDGDEVITWRTDPTNPDTDGDGSDDFYDKDPLYNLVVQIKAYWVELLNGTSGNFFLSTGIDGKWTVSKTFSGDEYNLGHTLSVDVNDSDIDIKINITLKSADREYTDINPDPTEREYNHTYYITDSEGYKTTKGYSNPAGEVGYRLKTIRQGKVNTLLIVPNDYSTVLNQSARFAGKDLGHRYLGEQRFVFLLLNCTGSNTHFDQYMNAIIIPRGVYYQSKLFKILNGSFDDVDNTPLEGATMIGHDNTNYSNLNSKVIQLIIQQNTSAGNALYVILNNYILKNESGQTAFTFLHVEEEIYTIGFHNDVLNITPYTAVTNTGNYTPPSPPPPKDNSWWGAFWNTLCGAAEFAWDAISSAATFMIHLVTETAKWLMNAFAELCEAVWTTVKAIAKAVVDAVNKLIEWLIEFVRALLSPLIDGMKWLVKSQVDVVSNAMAAAVGELNKVNPGPGYHGQAGGFIFGALILVGLWIFSMFFYFLAAVADVLTPFRFIMWIIVALLAGACAFAFLDLLEFNEETPSGDPTDDPSYGINEMAEKLPEDQWLAIRSAAALVAFLTSLGVFLTRKSVTKGLAAGFELALISITIMVFGVMNRDKPSISFLAASVGLVLAGVSLLVTFANALLFGLAKPSLLVFVVAIACMSILVGELNLERVW